MTSSVGAEVVLPGSVEAIDGVMVRPNSPRSRLSLPSPTRSTDAEAGISTTAGSLVVSTAALGSMISCLPTPLEDLCSMTW